MSNLLIHISVNGANDVDNYLATIKKRPNPDVGGLYGDYNGDNLKKAMKVP